MHAGTTHLVQSQPGRHSPRLAFVAEGMSRPISSVSRRAGEGAALLAACPSLMPYLLVLVLLISPHPSSASSFRDRYKLSYHVSGRIAASHGAVRSHGHLPGFQGLAASVPWFEPETHCEVKPRDGMPAGRWLVITKRRSGSRWLVDTMTERTAGNVPLTKELYCSKCHCTVVDEVLGPPQVG